MKKIWHDKAWEEYLYWQTLQNGFLTRQMKMTQLL